MNTRPLFFSLLAIFGISHQLSPGAAAQGSLVPPAGAPAPTMKTLDQLEPRTPVDAQHTPGDADSSYRITQPGSYYLTGNLTGVSGKSGIEIACQHVKLDLGGFELAGVAGSVSGVRNSADAAGLVVKNGTIRGWGQAGCATATATSVSTFDHLTVMDNGTRGLDVGFQSMVSNCIVSDNGSTGIETSGECTISNCIVSRNKVRGIGTGNNCRVNDCVVYLTQALGGSGGMGISADSGVVVSRCVCSGNASDGIHASDGALVKDCVCRFNYGDGIECATFNDGGHHRVEHCICYGNGDEDTGLGSGIVGVARCAVVDCTVNTNIADGISVKGDSTVAGCRASKNGSGATAAGIRVTGSGSRIEGNSTRDNKGTGILATAGDIIIRNSSGGNATANYTPNSGNNFAPVQTPAAQTNPNANH